MKRWISDTYRAFFPGKRRRGGQVLRRMIWLGCITVCIPIMAAGFIYYQVAMERTQNQIREESKATLLQARDRVERMMQSLEKDSLQLAADPLITDLFAGRVTDQPLVWHLNLLNKIALSKNANDFISEAYFYTTLESLVISNQYGGVELSGYKYREDVAELLRDGSPTRWVYLPGSRGEGTVTFARRVPESSVETTAHGVVALQVDMNAILGFLPEPTVAAQSGKELVFISSPRGQGLNAEQTELLLARLHGMTEAKPDGPPGAFDGFYEGTPMGRDFQVTYMRSVFGRTYVSVVPQGYIAAKLVWIRAVTLLSLFFFIVLAVIFTYFSAKRAYSPIEQLIKHSKSVGAGRISGSGDEIDDIRACLDYLSMETQQLGSYMEKAQPTLRERYLQKLISGDYVLSEALVRDGQTHGLEVHSIYGVMVVEVENVYRETRFLPGDKSVVAFAVANVLQELIDKDGELRGYVFPYQGKGIALLQWDTDDEQRLLTARMTKFAGAVCEALKSYLSFEASVGIGRCYSHLADVPVSYKEAEVALQYRIYQDTAAVLHIEDLESPRSRSALHYPRKLETAIVEALARSDRAEAGEALGRFMKALQASQSVTFVHQSYAVLLSAVISSMEKQGGSILDILEHNLFGQLEGKQTSRDIHDWFTGVLFPLHEQMTARSQHDAGQVAIRQICEYIREHSTDDLSLVQCADLVGMSPSYISRLFKKEMGVNFLEFVVECKLEEAKRLLLETDRSVSEIAATVGYSERNLTRVFQRTLQMTPGLYRAKYR